MCKVSDFAGREFVMNRCFGGFGLSEFAANALGCGIHDFSDTKEPEERFTPELVSAVKTMGREANGFCADLKVFTLPEGVTDFMIQEYDGFESCIYVLNGRLCQL